MKNLKNDKGSNLIMILYRLMLKMCNKAVILKRHLNKSTQEKSKLKMGHSENYNLNNLASEAEFCHLKFQN